MIELVDWIAVVPPEDKRLAYLGEHESVTRQFFLPDLAYRDYAFYVDMEFDLSTVTKVEAPRQVESLIESSTEIVDVDGVSMAKSASQEKLSYTEEQVTISPVVSADIAPLSKLVRADGILLTWTVLNQHTQLPGQLRATLRAVAPSGKVKKSSLMVFDVALAAVATPAQPIALTEHEQMERAMVLALEQAAEETLTAFSAQVNGEAQSLRTYVDEKTAPATAHQAGTVRVVPMNGVQTDAAGTLMVLAATERDVDTRHDIVLERHFLTPQTLDYAVAAVGDGRYATPADVAEAVATATPPIATKWMPGMVYATGDNGIGLEETGRLQLVVALEKDIDDRDPYLWSQKAITPSNLDYAVKAVGDGRYATPADIDEKLAPAGVEKYGTVKLGDSNGTGITVKANGELTLDAASQSEIDEGIFNKAITTVNIGYAVAAVGDGRYATPADIAEAVEGVKTPLATTSTPGAVYTTGNEGIELGRDGRLSTLFATPIDIDARNVDPQPHLPITPMTLDYAVKAGITANAESLTVGEQSAVRDWLGIGFMQQLKADNDYEVYNLAHGLYSVEHGAKIYFNAPEKRQWYDGSTGEGLLLISTRQEGSVYILYLREINSYYELLYGTHNIGTGAFSYNSVYINNLVARNGNTTFTGTNTFRKSPQMTDTALAVGDSSTNIPNTAWVQGELDVLRAQIAALSGV